MFENSLVLLITGTTVLVLAAVALLLSRKRPPTAMTVARARKNFYLRREWLEAKFFQLASQSGKPRGLEWVDVDFESAVSFARDRSTGRLRALVGVTIKFRAVEGGGMEDNPNVGNLRAASAMFFHDGTEWSTDGKAILNLNPTQAIEHFSRELELVE
ncbi:hypothetical protein Psta_2252 [Pirellula staleyi DSM 6068]|uniref:Uncharacterized protein n=1 Tax=Pirellula staleyi (strain ATCC 27377 / DSM 6068 / ICPB 4128) TaxID=530564 RepID=D2R2T3_PIRSD|nr:hypothetical protein [Pirellula staleyi]ADB16923.1 hypothetical protein Psta_2252 [Pirellula staleyi DSM 6068]